MVTPEFEDGDEKTIFVIIGRVFHEKGDEPIAVHILLSAPDDDTAVREALNALAQEAMKRPIWIRLE